MQLGKRCGRKERKERDSVGVCEVTAEVNHLKFLNLIKLSH